MGASPRGRAPLPWSARTRAADPGSYQVTALAHDTHQLAYEFVEAHRESGIPDEEIGASGLIDLQYAHRHRRHRFRHVTLADFTAAVGRELQ